VALYGFKFEIAEMVFAGRCANPGVACTGTLQAAAAVHRQGGDCQAHAAIVADTDVLCPHAEGVYIEEPTVPVQAAAA
jgi:hypothetical protein